MAGWTRQGMLEAWKAALSGSATISTGVATEQAARLPQLQLAPAHVACPAHLPVRAADALAVPLQVAHKEAGAHLQGRAGQSRAGQAGGNHCPCREAVLSRQVGKQNARKGGVEFGRWFRWPLLQCTLPSTLSHESCH